MNLLKAYSLGLLLVFFWQLAVLFYSPFVGATTRPNAKQYAKFGQLTIKKNESVKGNTAASGYFVEEVLEENYHAPENLVYHIPKETEFHFAFQLLKDYHAFQTEQLLPPEK